MEKYIEVELVEIEEERVVVLDGVKYLVLGELSKPRYKQEAPKPNIKPLKKASGRKLKERVTLGQVEPAVIKILGERPGLRNNELRKQMEKEFKLKPADSSFRSMLQRIKEKGLIEVNGTKRAAKWSLKKQGPMMMQYTNPLSRIKGPAEQEEHVEF